MLGFTWNYPRTPHLSDDATLCDDCCGYLFSLLCHPWSVSVIWVTGQPLSNVHQAAAALERWGQIHTEWRMKWKDTKALGQNHTKTKTTLLARWDFGNSSRVRIIWGGEEGEIEKENHNYRSLAHPLTAASGHSVRWKRNALRHNVPCPLRAWSTSPRVVANKYSLTIAGWPDESPHLHLITFYATLKLAQSSEDIMLELYNSVSILVGDLE